MSKFFLYARKSTDEPDRQILSIEAQLAEVKEFAEREHLEIVESFMESQTAKEPGRPIFNDMLSRIEKGEASGIVSWHPDRLARNSVDGGRVIYLMDTGKLVQLKFPTFWAESTPQGKFMLNIAFGQSKYYVDNLSENVKRGLRQKVRRGECPGPAPSGYLNDQLKHVHVPDPERFRLVKKLFELYATGEHSLKDCRDLITALGLVSRTGKVLSLSIIQKILRNTYYYGVFKFKGELYEGKHERAVSKQLYDQCQIVMRGKAHPMERGKQEFAFRGLMYCGECGGAITSERQKGHNYYRCTKKLGTCSQRYVREEELAAQAAALLKQVALSPASAEWMLGELEKEEHDSAEAGRAAVQSLNLQIKQVEEKVDQLLDARLENILSNEEYVAKKNQLLNQKLDLQAKLKEIERNGSLWFELCRNFIRESSEATVSALPENFSAQKNWIKKVGSNPTLANRTLTLDFKMPWRILAQSGIASRRDAEFPTEFSRNDFRRRVWESNPFRDIKPCTV